MSLLKLSLFLVAASAATAQSAILLSADPKYPADPNVTPYCSWWFDNEGDVTCDRLLSNNFISLEDFRRWNPSIGASCSGYETGRSYCVEPWGEPAPELEPGVSSTSSTSSSTAMVTSTTFVTTTSKPITTSSTTSRNWITTPTPTQPGMVTNCKKFHYVSEGNTCGQIISYNKITLADFVKWNTGVGSDCRNMWAKAYVCVGV